MRRLLGKKSVLVTPISKFENYWPVITRMRDSLCHEEIWFWLAGGYRVAILPLNAFVCRSTFTTFLVSNPLQWKSCRPPQATAKCRQNCSRFTVRIFQVRFSQLRSMFMFRLTMYVFYTHGQWSPTPARPFIRYVFPCRCPLSPNTSIAATARAHKRRLRCLRV